MKKILTIGGGIALSTGIAIPLSSCSTDTKQTSVTLQSVTQVGGASKTLTTSELEITISGNESIGALTSDNVHLEGTDVESIKVGKITDNHNGKYLASITGITQDSVTLVVTIMDVKSYIVNGSSNVILYKDTTTHVLIDSVSQQSGTYAIQDTASLQVTFDLDVMVMNMSAANFSITGDPSLHIKTVTKINNKQYAIGIQNIRDNNEILTVSLKNVAGYTVDNQKTVSVFKDIRHHFTITSVIADGSPHATNTTQLVVCTDIGIAPQNITTSNFLVASPDEATHVLQVNSVHRTEDSNYLLTVTIPNIANPIKESEYFVVSMINIDGYYMDMPGEVMVHVSDKQKTSIGGGKSWFDTAYGTTVIDFFASNPSNVTLSEKTRIANDSNLIEQTKEVIDTIIQDAISKPKHVSINDFKITIVNDPGQYDFSAGADIGINVVADEYSDIIDNSFTTTIKVKALSSIDIDTGLLNIQNNILYGFSDTVYAGNTIIVPDNVTQIADGAFKNDNTVEILKFNASSSCISIGVDVFVNNTKLKYINLPTSLQSLGTRAFSHFHDSVIISPLCVEGLEGTQITAVPVGLFAVTPLTSVLHFPSTFSQTSYTSSSWMSYDAPGLDFSEISSKVDFFGGYIFKDSTLGYIKFPYNITSFECWAFAYATIGSIVFENGAVPPQSSITFDPTAFLMTKTIRIYKHPTTALVNWPAGWPIYDTGF